MVDKHCTVNDYTAMEDRRLWSVDFNFRRPLTGAVSERLAEALEDGAASVFLHNQEATDGDAWSLRLTTPGPPDVDDLFTRIQIFFAVEGAEAPLASPDDIRAAPVPETDWLRHVHEHFPPVTVGKFFIFGSHCDGVVPDGLIPLRIDAATAFGSGEHETTRGCLLALLALKETGVAPRRVLDMGCGSGILAIAAAKLWPSAQGVAVDIDAEAARVTARHAEVNGVTARLTIAAGDGYAAPVVAAQAPYDILLANILAAPLIDMAPQAAAVLAAGGYAILSGLLARQRDDVIAAHAAVGFSLRHAAALGDWQALTLQKEGMAAR